MTNDKPYVQAACVCEHVLIEKDGVASIIRIVDNFQSPTDELLPTALTVFVCIKSGDVVGNYEIGLLLRRPDGSTVGPKKWPIVLKGGEHGAQLVMHFGISQPQVGLHWFDVLWKDAVLTSIPFRLKLGEPKAEVELPDKLERP